MSFPVFDPTQGSAPGAFSPARRLPTLSGIAVGLLDNGKPNADRFLAAVRELLAQHGVTEFVAVRKPASGGPAPAELLDDLALRTRAVITGVGD